MESLVNEQNDAKQVVLQVFKVSPTLQIARSKASNQISEDIPLTRAGELETTARRCGSPYDLALRSPTPSCALQNTEAQSYVTRWPCTRHLTSSSSAASAQILDFTLWSLPEK